jgi:hypothetical protein
MTLNLASFIKSQRAFSLKTFGDKYDAKRITAHIRKELLEVEESGDLSEWVDVILLALDGAWRSGASPEKICAALIGKLKINRARKWPDWRKVNNGQPIEHIGEVTNAHKHKGETDK